MQTSTHSIQARDVVSPLSPPPVAAKPPMDPWLAREVARGGNPRLAVKVTATLATILAILGQVVLGFEQPLFQVLLAVATSWSMAILLEWVDARINGRRLTWMKGGIKEWATVLAGPHMTGVTMSFLLFTGGYYMVMVFGVATAIASKYIFRVVIDGRPRHFFNPSNFGLVVTFFLFQWTTLIPYEYTESFYGIHKIVALALPAIIFMLGMNVNYRFTKRLPLVFSFWVGFALQSVIRIVATGSPLLSAFMPMTGIAFLLFSFYMITDPMTSPSSTRGQIIFGLSIAAVYAVFINANVFFTLLISVTTVCAIRGVMLYVQALMARRAEAVASSQSLAPSSASVAVGG